MPDDTERVLRRASELGLEFLAGLDERHVGAQTDDAGLVAKLAGPLPDEGEDPVAVVEQMARDVDPGLVASAGPRYFGFVDRRRPSGIHGRRLADGRLGPERRSSTLLSPAAAAVEQVVR